MQPFLSPNLLSPVLHQIFGLLYRAIQKKLKRALDSAKNGAIQVC